MDLQTIEQRLKSHEYRSLRGWKRDMSLIWENAYTFAGSSSWTGLLARHVKDIYERRLREMSTTNLDGWLNKVTELKEKLNKMMEAPPASVKRSAPLEMLARGDLEPFLPDDFTQLMRNIALLPNEEDRNKAKAMLGNPDNEVALTYLPLSLLHEVKAFVKDKTPNARGRSSLMGIGALASHEM